MFKLISLMNRRLVRAALSAALACAASTAMADIVIDAGQVIRKVPPTFNGTNIAAHFPSFATNANGIDFQGDLKASKVGLVRTLAYPDYRKPDHGLEYFDTNIKAIQAIGAAPLLIQYINPGQAYYHEDGTVGTAKNPGSPESNLVFMVRHYMAAPFNLQKQIWQVGNEPDIGVDYKIDVDAYAAQFNRVHEALTKAGLRENVTLCGPVVSGMYWDRTGKRPPVSDYIEAFLDRCSAGVDVVDLHTYCTFGAPMNDELLGLTRIDKLDTRFVTDQPNSQTVTYDGMSALLKKMDAIRFGRPDVGVAITEYGAMNHTKPLTGGLWNLAATQASLYNPRMRMLTSFLFDSAGKTPDTVSHYDSNGKRNYVYWALWMAGNLRGTEVLHRTVTGNAMADGRSNLVVAATRDEKYLYVEVINRSAGAIKDSIDIKGQRLDADAEVYTMAEGITPEEPKRLQSAKPITYEFPAASATVFRLRIQG